MSFSKSFFLNKNTRNSLTAKCFVCRAWPSQRVFMGSQGHFIQSRRPPNVKLGLQHYIAKSMAKKITTATTSRISAKIRLGFYLFIYLKIKRSWLSILYSSFTLMVFQRPNISQAPIGIFIIDATRWARTSRQWGWVGAKFSREASKLSRFRSHPYLPRVCH